MGVYRRIVFRTDRETRLLGSSSIVTAVAGTALIVFGGTAAGNTSTTNGSASGSIVLAGGPITEIVVEVSGSGSVALAGSAAGLAVKPGSGSGTIALAGVARCDAIGAGSISFGGSATVGSIFTMEASGTIALSGTATPAPIATFPSGSIVFSGTLGIPEISGGTVTSAASGQITWTGTALGGITNGIFGAIEFEGVATGQRLIRIRTPLKRCVIIPERRS